MQSGRHGSTSTVQCWCCRGPHSKLCSNRQAAHMRHRLTNQPLPLHMHDGSLNVQVQYSHTRAFILGQTTAGPGAYFAQSYRPTCRRDIYHPPNLPAHQRTAHATVASAKPARHNHCGLLVAEPGNVGFCQTNYQSIVRPAHGLAKTDWCCQERSHLKLHSLATMACNAIQTRPHASLQPRLATIGTLVNHGRPQLQALVYKRQALHASAASRLHAGQATPTQCDARTHTASSTQTHKILYTPRTNTRCPTLPTQLHLTPVPSIYPIMTQQGRHTSQCASSTRHKHH
jgi:hypothetical protein